MNNDIDPIQPGQEPQNTNSFGQTDPNSPMPRTKRPPQSQPQSADAPMPRTKRAPQPPKPESPVMPPPQIPQPPKPRPQNPEPPKFPRQQPPVTPPEPADKVTKSNKKAIIMIIAAAVLVAAVGIACWFIFSKDSGKSAEEETPSMTSVSVDTITDDFDERAEEEMESVETENEAVSISEETESRPQVNNEPAESPASEPRRNYRLADGTYNYTGTFYNENASWPVKLTLKRSNGKFVSGTYLNVNARVTADVNVSENNGNITISGGTPQINIQLKADDDNYRQLTGTSQSGRTKLSAKFNR